MAANTSPIFVASPNLAAVTFVAADGTTPKDLVPAGSDGTKILGIAATSDDSSAVVLRLYVHDGGAAYLVGAVSVPTLSGTDGAAPAVDLLDAEMLPWLDRDGELILPAGHKLQVAPRPR